MVAQRAVSQLKEFRGGLVQRALALDVAGATLARISAIAVVQAGLTHQVTELYKQTLDEARCKVDALSRRDCRQAAKLVGSVGSD